MAKKVIPMTLSQKSVQNVIKELRSYQNSLERKCEEYVIRLAKEGENVAIEAINESPIGKTVILQAKKEPSKMGCKAILVATGKTYQAEGREPFYTILAIEFGSGIYYNPEPNPKENDLGFGVGTFPGQIHAFKDGWYYLGKDDKWHYTHGIRATMPMFKASEEIIQKYIEIAKEVFGND